MMIYADDPRCERFSAITSEFVRPGNQLFAEWVGDDIHVRHVPADQANAVALSQALEGDRFLIATILEGVKERKAEITADLREQRLSAQWKSGWPRPRNSALHANGPVSVARASPKSHHN